jgi:hypothetical protein
VCMCAALLGVWLTGGDNNVFVQVGLVVLMGLACKNAILIVEFARELELQGKSIVEAALEACRMRLRPRFSRIASGEGTPRSHFGLKREITWSPALRRDAPEPTATTSPARSDPSTRGYNMGTGYLSSITSLSR